MRGKQPTVCRRHDRTREWIGNMWRCRACVRENNRRQNPRRIRMNAGGVDHFLGLAPTVEDAIRVRDMIRKEAPRCQ